LRLLENQAGEDKQAGDGSGIAGFQAPWISSRGFRKPPLRARRGTPMADRQEGIRQGRRNAAPDDCEIASATDVSIKRRAQPAACRRRQRSSIFAIWRAGQKQFPRHGGHRHDGQLPLTIVPVMFYRFQRRPKSQAES